jgi:hypothetical protein
MGTPARDTLVETLKNLRPGVSEIYLHPVEDGPELRGYDLEHASLRAADFDCLMDSHVRSIFEEHKIVPLSFHPLRELMRNAPAL